MSEFYIQKIGKKGLRHLQRRDNLNTKGSDVSDINYNTYDSSYDSD